MRRKIHDPTVVHSSIALLQERFIQLQSVKEMREKRELMKMLSTEPKHFNFSNPTTIYDQSTTTTRLFFHPELIIPSKSPLHVSLSLWPTSQGMQEDNNNNHNSSTNCTVESTTVSKNLCSTQPVQASWKDVYDSDSGVDTSLHL